MRGQEEVDRWIEKERKEGDLLQGLAHVVMEAEKPHSVPSASWRPRKTGVLHSQSRGPRTGSADLCGRKWVSPQKQGA